MPIQPHVCYGSLELWTRFLPLLLFLNSKKIYVKPFSHLIQQCFIFHLFCILNIIFFCLKMHGALNSLVHFDMLMFTMQAIYIGG